jgi:hypothetical protein
MHLLPALSAAPESTLRSKTAPYAVFVGKLNPEAALSACKWCGLWRVLCGPQLKTWGTAGAQLAADSRFAIKDWGGLGCRNHWQPCSARMICQTQVARVLASGC